MTQTESAIPPRVAVCMAAYNGAAFIDEQIRTIMLSRNVDVHLYVSLDPSTDSTALHVEEAQREFPAITLLPRVAPSGGASANFFRLIADVDFAAFDYVALADQDDVWFPDKLARGCQALRAADAQGYSSNITAFWPDGRERLIDKARPQKEWDHLFESRGPGCTFVLTRALAIELQLLVRADRANRAELGVVDLHDWFVYAFARARGYKWTMDAAPSMRYRQHAGNEVGVNVGWRAAARRVRKLLSGWQIQQARSIAVLTGLDKEDFVKRTIFGGRTGLLRLAFSAGQCRRQAAHQLVFAFSCLCLSVKGMGSDNSRAMKK